MIPPRPVGGSLAFRGGQPLLTLALGILLINAAVVLWLLFLGREFLPENVPLYWWNPSTALSHNSQHLTDFYSALHAISGAALFFLARRLRPGWPVGTRLLLVIACSGLWEIVENTPWVISLFNDPDGIDVYQGDSIVNALSDTGFVALGFLAAHNFPRWLVIAGGGLAEIAVALMIHDGFVLGTARMILR
ncbi:DUF2585 family protein [Paracoccus sp. MC1862]|nr:DUF2585 family protein [Paracoccus sp. MC1862]